MDRLARLLDDCRAHPDDDAPRLVWADAAGGERGEFVVLQCELARGVSDPLRNGELRVRAADLLDRHGPAWANLGGVARAGEFRRGFVEVVRLDGAIDPAVALTRAPLTRALVSEVHDRDEIDRLFAAPATATLAGLYVEVQAPPSASRIIHPLGLRPRGLGAVIDEHIAFRALDNLRAFGSNAVDVDDLVHVAVRRKLERLHIPGVRMTRAQAHRLFARARHLRALCLQTHDENVLDLIPDNIVELLVDLVDEHELAAFARSPAAGSVERLCLFGRIDSNLEVLAACRNLRSLDLQDVEIRGSKRGASAALAALDLPSLRELSLSWSEDVTAIARAFGPQLELFEYPRASVQPLVSGATFATRARPVRQLAIAATLSTHEPWLTHSVVEYD